MDIMLLNFDYETLNWVNGITIGIDREQDEEIIKLTSRHTENVCHN